MTTAPEETRALGEFIRAARVAKGINQLRAAREARVSRRQLDILERGGNVSVKFLLKVARYLQLTALPLDGSVQLVAGVAGVNIFELMQSLDLIFALVERTRDLAMNAVLPPSERGVITDTPALKDFIARHVGNPEGAARLARAMMELSEEPSKAIGQPAAHADEPIRARRTKKGRE
jgi:transcriptional regulator with XRE-family HTH domain